MSPRVALLVHLLLVVDKADSKKGELPFVTLTEQSLNMIGVLYLAGTVFSVQRKLGLVQHQLVVNSRWLYPFAKKKS